MKSDQEKGVLSLLTLNKLGLMPEEQLVGKLRDLYGFKGTEHEEPANHQMPQTYKERTIRHPQQVNVPQMVPPLRTQPQQQVKQRVDIDDLEEEFNQLR